MPLYDFKCQSCGQKHELYAKIEERNATCECGGNMDRLITSRYYAHSDLKPYLDEHIGDKPVWVQSRKHRRQLMREHGVYEAHGKGWL